MEAEKDYGIARYGARLSRAKLHMRKMELEVQLCLSRLIDAKEAAEIAAILGQNAPGCSVLLSAQFEDGLPASEQEGFLDMLRASWEHFSPLMKPVLGFSQWERGAEGIIAVRIPKRLYLSAKSYNGANMLEKFIYDTYGENIEVMLIGDESIALIRQAKQMLEGK